MIFSVLFMVAYVVLFAIVHSPLADSRFKSWAEKAPCVAFDRWQRLAYNLLARHEERSLQEEFAREYEDYRKKVPMFLPRLWCQSK